ncbi:hypothetical protein PAXRUDRAFT_836410, partial [Paxillus rubicundulus Ve08.2h10]
MQFFLMLLASITSLSVHTLVGVHADCATCPEVVANEWHSSTCHSLSGVTFCYYESDEVQCSYTSDGTRLDGAEFKCPTKVPGHSSINCD